MRLLDLFQSLPVIVVALTIVALAGSSFSNVVIALGLIMIPQFVRITRAEALVVRSHRFIEASEAVGASGARVTFRHVLPNVMPVVLAQLSLSAGMGLLAIAGLGFLGVGVQPSTPSWGLMLERRRTVHRHGPVVGPGPASRGDRGIGDELQRPCARAAAVAGQGV